MEYDLSVDHYEVLGLENSYCSEEEIKIAYRKLALKHHPDKQANHSTTEREESSNLFTLIQTAWEILSDKDKRKVYDREWTKKQARGLHAEDVTLCLHTKNCNESTHHVEEVLGDFQYDPNNEVWYKACRCGELYQVSVIFIFLVLSSFALLFYYLIINQNNKQNQ